MWEIIDQLEYCTPADVGVLIDACSELPEVEQAVQRLKRIHQDAERVMLLANWPPTGVWWIRTFNTIAHRRERLEMILNESSSNLRQV